MDIKLLKNDYDSSPSLNKLIELRKSMVDSLEANDAFEGFRSLLTQLYPDNAHYIFELIQNAEDASKNNKNLTTVRFILTQEYLKFEHNGEKLFDIKDIYSITTIGDSTKIDDKTNIGKFGIGFKSVFAITETPEIISGKYHFSIKNMFIPVPMENKSNSNNISSHFIFPFNNPRKNKLAAVEEIEKELLQLGSETLLFLKRIEKIEYSLSDGELLGYLKQNENEENIVTITVEIPNEGEKTFYWLRYIKDIIVKDEKGKDVPCSIAIAFKLEKIERFNKNENEGNVFWKIKSEEIGKVCIYFPAEDERSQLHFNMHAPFASTVARNSIRKEDCKENEILRDAIAELISDSLFKIKKRNLLTVDFLGILPNANDNLSPFYEPIRLKIISTFKENPLVPTKNGDFSTASSLFRCPKRVGGGLRIDEVIDDNDLSFLIDRPVPLWAKNANPNNPREDQFLDSLEIKEWGKKELIIILNPKNEEEQKKIEKWISKKLDQWLLNFYALLENLDINKDSIDKSLKFIRLTNDTCISISETSYFIPEDEEDLPENINFIKRNTYDIYEGKEPDKRKKDAYNFLEKIGVKKYDLNVKMRLRLEKIANKYLIQKPVVSVEQNLNDIKEFCLYKYSNELLVNKYFLLDINNNYCKADTLCTTLIFNLIDQANLSAEYNKICINKIYENELNDEQKIKFKKLITELGIMHCLKIDIKEDYMFYGNYKEKISRDYIIKGLEKIITILNNEPYIFAKLIWDAIQVFVDSDASSSYYSAQRKYSKPNKTCTLTFGFKEYKEPSTIVKMLASSAWIPDKDGKLNIPKEISSDMLPTDFIINRDSVIFNALNFGKDKIAKLSVLQKRTEAAKVLGLNPDVVESLIESGIDINNILYDLNNAKQNIFQDETDEIFDPDDEYDEEPFTKEKIENIKNIYEYIENQFYNESTPRISIEVRPRSIRTSRNVTKEHSNIKNRYHGYCQICKERKPNWDITAIFKVRQREVFSKKLYKELKEFEQLNLSLCLYCTREYRKKRENDENMKKFLTNILNANPEESADVIFDGNYVRFTNTHLAEIKRILTLECE